MVISTPTLEKKSADIAKDFTASECNILESVSCLILFLDIILYHVLHVIHEGPIMYSIFAKFLLHFVTLDSSIVGSSLHPCKAAHTTV